MLSRDQKKEALKKVFYNWWADLYDIYSNPPSPNRAELACLRRLQVKDFGGTGPQPDVIGALALESFQNLLLKTRAALGRKLTDAEESDLFVVATALARVRDNDRNHKSVMAALGGKEPEDRKLKEVRFLRLMRTDNASDLFHEARRLCALAKNAARVDDLGLSLFLWRTTPSVRRKWAQDYYAMNDYENDDKESSEQQATSIGA